KFGSNPDDPLEVLVTQIVPVDEDVKKYMAQQLDSKVSK
ncbi:VSK-int, partial [Vibrio vulnificus]|nr:VSK-int [Vibrio vulnificus]EIJ0948689.1 VSK-int [Vibrio vulnificus]